MLQLVRELRWSDVEASLEEKPELLDVRDEKGRNWLHVCCSVNPKDRRLRTSDSVRLADVFLDAGLDVNEAAFREGDWKATALWYAVARGENLTLARHLLERGSDPNHCLWAAAYHDDVPAIHLLVNAGADVDPVTEDETPFLAAVKTSHFRAAQALLELGANVDFQDSRGRSALHYMLRKASDERHFRMLVSFGARGDLPDRDGSTAFEAISRKRASGFRKLAAQLATKGRAAGAARIGR
jgi:ankyrin repeat protein